jgi:uncharacterized membrane protein
VALGVALAAARAQEEPSETPPSPPRAEAPARGTLDVQVVDEGGNRLRAATVAVPGYRSTTGIAGNARFSLLPGRYSVLISKSGFRGRRVSAGVRPNETTSLKVVLEKLPAGRTQGE